jgi:CO/xanthine dehydrogenase FAD-binding subunit
MKPPRFRYVEPDTVADAVAALGKYGEDAKILAGGQSLVPMLSMRLAYPEYLVDINRLGELDGIDAGSGALRVGALTRHSTLEHSPVVAGRCPLLGRGMRWVGHRSIRTRGTIGGSLAHADPAAELPAMMIALEATVVARSPRGDRDIPIGQFFEMALVTALAPDELLTEVRVPAQSARAGSAVVELARRHGDFAVAGVVASLELDDVGRIQTPRLVGFATGPVPQRLHRAEAALAGARPVGDPLDEASRGASEDVSPTDDIHGSATYRREVTGELVRRAVAEAAADAGARSARA